MEGKPRRGTYGSAGAQEPRDGGAYIKPSPRLRAMATRNSGNASVAFSVNDFKGVFAFDDFFNSLVQDILPPEGDAFDGEVATTPNGSSKLGGGTHSVPGYPEAATLLPLFKDARKELIDLSRQVDARLSDLRTEVAAQDVEHKETLSKLERGVEGLFNQFGRLDARISGVGQTATRIGDHLQSADAQRELASQTIDLIKYLMDFNSSRGDLLQYSPPAAVFSDDARMGEAAAIARKLRSFAEDDGSNLDLISMRMRSNSGSSPGLEVAAANLQEYCSDLENKLLNRFDAAAQKRDKATMAECAKILEEFQGGTRAMHRYVASRPMFLDIEVMNSDLRVALGDVNGSAMNPARGLPILYKQILDTVREESTVVAAVFPSPRTVMSLLVQRVMEQRVVSVLERILPQPALKDPPPLSSGGLLAYLRMLAASYEKTLDFAKELRAVGCGDLDVEGLAESVFSYHKDRYHEVEQGSLKQLFHAKYLELNEAAQAGGPPESPLLRVRSGFGASSAGGNVVAECVRWNEEAIARCRLLISDPVPLVENVKLVFGVFLDQVSVYTLLELEKAQKALIEAAALRDKVSIGTSVSRRLAAAVAAAAEQAAVAGEQGMRTFMSAIKRAAANVATVHQHFINTVSRLLLPVEGAHAACIEEISAKMSEAENLALRSLQACIHTAICEVERLLAVEQKPTDYRPAEDNAAADHRPTRACIQVVAYLERVAEMAHASLEGPNRQAFFADLGSKLHKALLTHIQRFTFSPSGGLRLKRDVSEYADFVRTFKAPAVDEKFEGLGTLVNVFIVAPGSLPTLVDSSHLDQKDAHTYIQLRDDYKSSKIAGYFKSMATAQA